MHKLQYLLQNLVLQEIIGNTDINISSICIDSRQAQPGGLFVALPGTILDGQQYIADAISAGSIAILCAKKPEQLFQHITYICTTQISKVLGTLASNFYDNPSQKLQLIAVTGTSGKTSTVHILHALFRHLGYSVGILSTIHNKIDDEIFPSTLTTPDAIQINKALAQMLVAGCQYCFMEASSHALVQNRMAGLSIAGAVFLNISHDHLDYHLTFDAYIQAKKKLFHELPKKAFAIYNADDKRGPVMVQNTKAKVYSLAMKSPADFTAQVITNSWQGLELVIANQNVWVQMLGNFNTYNLLAAYAVAKLLHQDSQDVLIGLSKVRPILGRFQHITTPKKVAIIIDYAHKPGPLEKVLLALQEIRKNAWQKGKIISIVGCGGNRDTKKRPMMAKIGYKLSDQLILTSDNPRYEDPGVIIEDMKQGLIYAEQMKTITIIDRTEAIKTAYQIAQPHDVILIAGKGHEGYQEIAGKKYPLKDEDIVNKLLIATHIV